MRALAALALLAPLAASACGAIVPDVGTRIDSDASACEADEYVDAAYGAPAPAEDAGCGDDT